MEKIVPGNQDISDIIIDIKKTLTYVVDLEVSVKKTDFKDTKNVLHELLPVSQCISKVDVAGQQTH